LEFGRESGRKGEGEKKKKREGERGKKEGEGKRVSSRKHDSLPSPNSNKYTVKKRGKKKVIAATKEQPDCFAEV